MEIKHSHIKNLHWNLPPQKPLTAIYLVSSSFIADAAPHQQQAVGLVLYTHSDIPQSRDCVAMRSLTSLWQMVGNPLIGHNRIILLCPTEKLEQQVL